MAAAVLKHTKSTKRNGNTKALALATAANITPKELNAQDSHGRTVLFYAARYGKANAVKNLLSAGSDPNVNDTELTTPLHEATERSHHDIIKLLVKHEGTDLDAKNCHGQTPVMKAVLYDDLEALKLLHKAGAKLDEEDYTGKTALLIALSEGRERTTEYLIKNGCDVNKRDKLGQSALYLAIVSSNIASSENIKKIMRSGYTVAKDRHWLNKAGVDVESLHQRNFFQRILSRIRLGGGSARRYSEGSVSGRSASLRTSDEKPHPRFESRSNSCDL
ncbi:hypothetical protein FSP39_010139 [Pinctada imbricata]|uniref:Uncharacterized protein n=1 Tax=Pinctada imbricata TaxID=66713 RepID=A0AA88XD33_PINIB|nr:hypothetical protein FSP39_010139 [Pinctada imbricata]